MGVIVDSSVIITLERQGGPFDRDRLGLADEPVGLSTITASELLVGIHRAATSQQRSDREVYLETLFRTVQIFPFDLAVARVHAQLWSHLSAAGTRIGDHDLIIGATALANGHEILTENLREFERIPGLVTRRPDW